MENEIMHVETMVDLLGEIHDLIIERTGGQVPSDIADVFAAVNNAKQVHEIYLSNLVAEAATEVDE